MNFNIDELTILDQDKLVAGIDEVGRGCIAGPVVAAVVVIDKNFDIFDVEDSKIINREKREILYNKIINRSIEYKVSFVDNYEIDIINILSATFKAMNNAIDSLFNKPSFYFIDGNKFNGKINNYATKIKGDANFVSIASASIIAKVSRDNWMNDYASKIYPEYNFEIHKGYPTKLHFERIEKYGICEIHRKSFLKKYFMRKKQLFIFNN